MQATMTKKKADASSGAGSKVGSPLIQKVALLGVAALIAGAGWLWGVEYGINTATAAQDGTLQGYDTLRSAASARIHATALERAHGANGQSVIASKSGDAKISPAHNE